LIVITGESGCGKSTLEKMAVEAGIKKVVSTTTRLPRSGEVDGVDYNFIDYSDFFKLNDEGKLAESVLYNGNYYGIRVEDCVDDVIAVVEPNGLKQLLCKKDLNITVIYLKSTDEERAMFMLKRGDTFDAMSERILKDRTHFAGVEELADTVIESKTTKDLTKALEIIKIIMGV
jgi:guanylate kinase